MARQSASIIIVGGGVIGLSIARALAIRGGNKVLLLERAGFGQEASFAAAGMLAPQAEADQPDQFFNLASRSRDSYPAFAHSLLEETGIDVELDLTGTLYLAFSSEDLKEIEERYNWQRHAGLAIEKLTANQIRTLEPCISRNVCGGLRFPKDVQVENRRLVRALIDSCLRYEVSLMPDITVDSLRLVSDRVAGVETSRGFFASDTVVVAGGAWTSRIKGLPDIPIEPVRGQMLCLQGQSDSVRHIIYSPRGYVVPRRDGRLLAGSTTERVGFNKEVTEAGIQSIKSSTFEMSPVISSRPVVNSWAGLRPRAPDSLPLLGPYDEIEGLVYATGHYRNGILLAPITGELIAGAIIDNEVPPLLATFAANRFGLVQAN